MAYVVLDQVRPCYNYVWNPSTLQWDAETQSAGSSTVNDSDVVFSDITTGNVSSTKHGFAPKSPGDATKFLNGAATPDYAQVKDSDLAFTDITTNDASITKHGFLPKLGNDATKFFNGQGIQAQVKDSDLALTDITTNDVTSTKHGFAPKTPADATKFLNGATTATFAQVKDSDLVFTDITTNNASTTQHGFLQKLDNSAVHFLDGQGNWSSQKTTINFSVVNQSPADSTTYYFGYGTGANSITTTEGNAGLVCPFTGTITAAYAAASVFGTLGSGESSTVAVKNKTTGTSFNISTAVLFNSAAMLFYSVTGQSLAVSAGDLLEIKWTTPGWGTNPTNAMLVVSVIGLITG